MSCRELRLVSPSTYSSQISFLRTSVQLGIEDHRSRFALAASVHRKSSCPAASSTFCTTLGQHLVSGCTLAAPKQWTLLCDTTPRLLDTLPARPRAAIQDPLLLSPAFASLSPARAFSVFGRSSLPRVSSSGALPPPPSPASTRLRRAAHNRYSYRLVFENCFPLAHPFHLKVLSPSKSTQRSLLLQQRRVSSTTYARSIMEDQAVAKKVLNEPMAAAYQPAEVERGWYAWWEKQNFFSPTDLTLHQRNLPSGLPTGSSPSDFDKKEKETPSSSCASSRPPPPPSYRLAETTQPGNKFVMVIPPPNVTGSLHIGHALTGSIEDALTRWHRMNGKVVLWVPGADHAGIATQSVVERVLMKGGKSRHDLGRQAFVEKVWEWKREYGDTICNQLRRIGSSVSWPHFCFTLDEKLSRAVVEAFVRLYDAGLIYREERLVSWSPFLKTAISDIEVDVEEIDKPKKISIPGFEYPVEVGYLWHFWYEVEGGGRLEVATTRIETMLGDVAVAVNPTDERYKGLVGKKLKHPFFPEREMVVVADEHVEASFGTGAVKITPAHDKNDFAIAKRHNLPSISVFTLDGKISEEGGIFAGQHRFECRFKIQQALKELGLLGEKVPNTHKMQLPRCSRSGDVIEYMLIPQWWCACKEMADKSLEAVRNGELQIVPRMHEETWYNWLENIKEWCISRQLWWGHRIPAYRIVKPAQETETWVVGRNLEEALDRACKKLGVSDKSSIGLEQDEDVLDTWFSSGLFPFSVFGWPEDTGDMRAFFPGTLLETGHDILFFWVARMVMMSLELTKKLPFKTVFLHAMVRDAHGQKMSKSKGNVIDPLEVIHGISLQKLQEKLHQGNLPEKEIKRAEEVLKKEFPNGIEECGCDALRIGLLAYTRQGRNVNLDLNRVVGYRHFCNKLWNATKFAIDKFGAAASILASCVDGGGEKAAPEGAGGAGGGVCSNGVTSVGEGCKVNGTPERGCTDTSAGQNGAGSAAELRLSESFRPGGVYMGGVGGKAIHGKGKRIGVSYHELQWVDRWILHRLSVTCAEMNRHFEEYAFSEVVTAIFNFFLYDLCDYYLELTKQRLAVCTPGEKSASRLSSLCALEVLYVCLDRGLRLLHPLCPFITEELHQRLPPNDAKPDSICIADYPQPVLQWIDHRLDTDMELFKNVVSRFRSLQAALDIPPKIRPAGYILLTTASPTAAGADDVLSSLAPFLREREAEVATMAKMSSVKLRMPDEGAPARCVSDVVNGSITIFLSVEEGVNLGQTLEKMNKKKSTLEKMIQGYEKKEAMPSYEDKVPLDVREQNALRKNELKSELTMLLQAIENMKRLACE